MEKGAAAFGAGFGSGVLATYGPAGWAAGGALLGATNSWLAGTDILQGTISGAAAGIIGGQLGQWVGKLGGVAINGVKINIPILKGLIGGAIGGSIGGGLTGFSMSLLFGSASFNEALTAGFLQAKMGLVVGGVTGMASAYVQAKANGLDPITGKVKEIDGHTIVRHHTNSEKNVIHQEKSGNDSFPYVRL